MDMSVPLKLNAAGFMSQECPRCERIFKIQPGRGSDQPVAHCPYCDHEGRDCWWTTPQAKFIGEYAAAKVVGPKLGKILKGLGTKGRGGGVSITATARKKPLPMAPAEHDDQLPAMHFVCCDETIRHDGQSLKLWCPLCGAGTSI